MISAREHRAARSAEARWSVKWTKWEREFVKLAIYGAKKALPAASGAYLAHIDTHALEIVRADVEAAIPRYEQWHQDSVKNVADAKAELERVVASGRKSVSTEQERVRWHERQAKQKAQNAARARRLLDKLRKYGLPAGAEVYTA